MKRIRVAQIKTMEDYFSSIGNVGKVQKACDALENIQTDIDYEVGLQQTYALWQESSKLVKESCLGEVSVSEFYYLVFKNSGILDYCSKKSIDEMILKKMKGVIINNYSVGVKSLDIGDNVVVNIQVKFTFAPNSMVNELIYQLSAELDCTGEIVESNVSTFHQWKCQVTSIFFKQLEDVECLLLLLNKIIPYSYDYYSNIIPPLIFDQQFEEEEDDDDYDENDDGYDEEGDDYDEDNY
ncbi:hypothetical protein EHI8A_039230 [Entamoeba histolytica HM-1:IMSS-B]|uniref:Nucleosome assembly protein n=6 Tax=Entamoeba histolytica TaxID=5759 RepID=C4M212_ENTH1|nr:hypothetical protein EHI_165340 [Entamoeba histolytica HM-1:IMSS]EMD45457.1 Hypothetical protein EHI5A_072070 [Entamoeba histolytica KU27]EMH77113.1 hypothetical protein EHI8A_039230 [Entamoeba histolytica HM-1:IMSS-B]EMS11566.1 hypothetical protein KM1_080880 [Entamoeba histolytica HM-3:IMSS]ENY61426.1 hypothetical protein EHI7A_040430 [Entamoeba histolytica HM-1:IMSS-A]GAT95289.1 hypothetical protein CL6EHI_165340 [Entamoeba histolytica]|eukprot:XP_649757.1 hypothetical protein EHI_165340 [Entamoeba histolytica HM-1:IMSS]